MASRTFFFNGIMFRNLSRNESRKENYDLVTQDLILDKAPIPLLAAAAYFGQRYLVEYLINNKGINVNERSPKGLTALHASCMRYNGVCIDITRYLIAKGAVVRVSDFKCCPVNSYSECQYSWDPQKRCAREIHLHEYHEGTYRLLVSTYKRQVQWYLDRLRSLLNRKYIGPEVYEYLKSGVSN